MNESYVTADQCKDYCDNGNDEAWNELSGSERDELSKKASKFIDNYVNIFMAVKSAPHSQLE